MRAFVLPICLAAVCVLAACGDEDDATVVVTAYGESFIEEGIPAAEVGDGWAVDFTRFEVGLRDVQVGGVAVPVTESIDLARGSAGEGHEVGSLRVAPGSLSGASFSVVSVEVEGRAVKGEATKTFSWAFDETTRYADCDATTTPSAGESASFQITIHADHLLYDSLVAEDPGVVFQALADADGDRDGVIAREELAATDIGAYDPGSTGGVDDLWTWLAAQVRTLGHVNGEGHCDVVSTE